MPAQFILNEFFSYFTSKKMDYLNNFVNELMEQFLDGVISPKNNVLPKISPEFNFNFKVIDGDIDNNK